MAVPWRERPPEMAAWPAKPAARDVVAHATLSSQRRVTGSLARVMQPRTFADFKIRVGTESDSSLDRAVHCPGRRT